MKRKTLEAQKLTQLILFPYPSLQYNCGRHKIKYNCDIHIVTHQHNMPFPKLPLPPPSAQLSQKLGRVDRPPPSRHSLDPLVAQSCPQPPHLELRTMN